MKRGQVFSSDFAVAAAIFLFILTISVVAWNDLVDRTASAQDRLLNAEAAERAMGALLSTGSPVDWPFANASQMQIPGLAEKPGVLSQAKLDAFSVLDYNVARTSLGLPRFEARFSLTKGGETTVMLGSAPTADKSVAVAERTVALNGLPAVVRVEVWR